MINIKFAADVNIEKTIIDYLTENKFDVKWIPDYDCEILDEELLNLANKERRILITNDKDFGELTFLQKRISTGIILLRIKGQKARDKVKLIDKVLQKYRDKLMGHFVVITKNKIRFVPMEKIK
jgi:predicted nuclease of predicted toxin-antitoxin system